MNIAERLKTTRRRFPKLPFVILAFLFGTATLAQKATPTKEETPVKAEMVVSLERPTIREKDKVPVHVVVSNPSDRALSGVTLTWSIPSDFLTLASGPCSDASAQSPQTSSQGAPGFTWLNIPANTDPQSVRTQDFCLVSSTAAEDTLNLVFVLQYGWMENGSPRHAAITVEKSIKSALLGSDTLAGIPLGLASIVVPGLLFWLLLDWWQTSWRVQGNVLGEKMIYSVLVSAAVIGVLGIIPPLKPYANIYSGLSMTKVWLLALAGALAGLLVGGGDHFLVRYKAARALNANDSTDRLLEKLLRANIGKKKPKTLVTTRMGDQYRGSVGARTAAGTFLMGWCRIIGAQDQHLRTKIQQLIDRADYIGALKLARKHNLTFTDTRDFIWEQPHGVGTQNQDAQLMRLTLAPDDVTQPIEVTDNDADPRPLELA